MHEMKTTPTQDTQTATIKVAELVGEIVRLEPYLTSRARRLLGAIARWASEDVETPAPPASTRRRSTSDNRPAANQQTLGGVQ